MARDLVRASTEYLTLASPSQIAITTGSFSMAFRVNLRNGGGGIMVRENAGVTGFLAAELDNNAFLYLELFDSVTGHDVIAASASAFVGGGWEDGVVVRDTGAGQAVVYLNGTAGTPVTDNTGDLSNGGSLNWYLGYRFDSGPFGGLKGMDGILGEMAIWTTALSSSDVASFHAGNGANCIQSASLVAYWKMNTNTSPEPDWKYGNSATLVNAPSYATGPTVSYCDGGGWGPLLGQERSRLVL